MSLLKFKRTHQHSGSQNASKVPDLNCDVFAVHGRSSGEEEQDVTQHTYNSQRHQTDPQALGKAAWTHSDANVSTSTTSNSSLSLQSIFWASKLHFALADLSIWLYQTETEV